jgi:hypothetical protein
VVTTILSPLDQFNIIAVLAPEVYMTMYHITFSENSVSDDRKSIDQFLKNIKDSSQYKRYMWQALEAFLSCPHVLKAIDLLYPLLDTIEDVGSIPGETIHQMIDPVLSQSVYSLGLRELLKERNQQG